MGLYHLLRIWYVVPQPAPKTDIQLIWLKELLEPTVISPSIIDQTHKSLTPAWGETIDFDEVGMACYGQAQMTFNYRGHEVIK